MKRTLHHSSPLFTQVENDALAASIHIPAGRYIDNASVVYYDQLYAQVMYELRDKQIPFWFSNDEVIRLQNHNLSFFKTDDLETMVRTCFRVPGEEEEAKWMNCSEVFDVLHEEYPMLMSNFVSDACR